MTRIDTTQPDNFIAKIHDHGQVLRVTIPAEIIRKNNWKPGTTIRVWIKAEEPYL
jgi:bifunctional DNA-binding transcriptional regulator/antitoxin component of YhaV-PrlF toxin-antitoxin module